MMFLKAENKYADMFTDVLFRERWDAIFCKHVTFRHLAVIILLHFNFVMQTFPTMLIIHASGLAHKDMACLCVWIWLSVTTEESLTQNFPHVNFEILVETLLMQNAESTLINLLNMFLQQFFGVLTFHVCKPFQTTQISNGELRWKGRWRFPLGHVRPVNLIEVKLLMKVLF